MRRIQLTSIHSRRRLGSFLQLQLDNEGFSPPDSPPPPPMSAQLPQQQQQQQQQVGGTIGRSTSGRKRQEGENRLLSQLWLMSAATFRRFGNRAGKRRDSG